MTGWTRWGGAASVCALAVVLAACSAKTPQTGARQTSAPAGAESVQRRFGGTYDTLLPEQRRLVNGWFRQLSALTGRDVPPDVGYNLARLSTRTTFDAVTNALIKSELTDESGISLGSALDLVARLESVKGKIKGARGDSQYRIFVELEADALEILGKGREFKRTRDNTVYHKGYPISYRQQPTVPSVQFSITSDGLRADIDVDYRSSSFPGALFNGHLTASNSDVRAGNNHERHVNRWEGLVRWWEGLFGLPLGQRRSEEELGEDLLIPAEPRAGREKIHLAVEDFLRAWLVERHPEQATAYLAESALECLAFDLEERGETFNRGMLPFMMMMRMSGVAAAIGPISSLEEALVGVRVSHPELRVVRQPHHARFVLYEVSDRMAKSFMCGERTALRKQARHRPAFGTYYGSVFHMTAGAVRGATVALLWKKQAGNWKILAYEVEPEGEDDAVPDLRPQRTAVSMQRQAGDQRLITAARDFLQAWLVDKRYEDAFDYLSPRSYSCYNLYRDKGRPEATSNDQAGRLILEGMKNAGAKVGDIAALQDAISSVDLEHPELVLVSHPDAEAFTLVGASDRLGEAADCYRKAQGVEPQADTAGRFGRYYATLLQFGLDVGEPAVLALVWARETTGWKIVAFSVEEP